MIRFKKLRNKIMFYFSMLILVFMGVTMLLIYFSTARIVEQLAVVYARQTTSKMLENLDYLLKDANKASLNIMVDDEIVDLFKKEFPSGGIEDLKRKARITQKLRKLYINSYDFKIEANLLNERRNIFFSSYDSCTIGDIVSTDWYKNIIWSDSNLTLVPTHKMNYKFDGITKVVTLIRRFNDMRDNNKGIGYIFIDINYNDISKVAENTRKNDYIYILDTQGAEVYNSSKESTLTGMIGRNNVRKLYTKTRDVLNIENTLVIYDTSSFSGWKIVNVISYANLLENVYFIRNTIFILGILGILGAIFISFIISDRIIRPLTEMRKVMAMVEQGELTLRFQSQSNDEVKLLGDGFNSMLDEINLLIRQLMEKEKDKREAMLFSLQSQINPHFLYNTLNSIRFLSSENRNSDVSDVVNAFIHLLRSSISNPNEFIHISDELENTISYVKIQQIRYTENFKVVYDIDSEALNYGIPKLTLQPLVENAIFHGIEPKGSFGTIKIIISMFDENIEISIIDDGVGMRESDNVLKNLNSINKNKYSNIGVKNVHDRIRLHFGDNYGVSVKSLLGCGTKVTVKFPARIFDDGREKNVESTSC